MCPRMARPSAALSRIRRPAPRRARSSAPGPVPPPSPRRCARPASSPRARRRRRAGPGRGRRGRRRRSRSIPRPGPRLALERDEHGIAPSPWLIGRPPFSYASRWLAKARSFNCAGSSTLKGGTPNSTSNSSRKLTRSHASTALPATRLVDCRAWAVPWQARVPTVLARRMRFFRLGAQQPRHGLPAGRTTKSSRRTVAALRSRLARHQRIFTKI